MLDEAQMLEGALTALAIWSLGVLLLSPFSKVSPEGKNKAGLFFLWVMALHAFMTLPTLNVISAKGLWWGSHTAVVIGLGYGLATSRCRKAATRLSGVCFMCVFGLLIAMFAATYGSFR